MKFDASLPPVSLDKIPEIAQSAEEIGFDTLWSAETKHDPFLPGPLVFNHTRKLSFGTSIAVAFARSPATLAYTAWDLAQASAGRFILGLGTQVRAHIERRFGLDWPESVVDKLHEQVEAVRAFWHTWQTGEKLNYRGNYYKLTLMSPFFNPGPIDHPDIPIYIAGVNTGLARLAGQVADGFVVHPLHTRRYLEEVILPAIHIATTAFVVKSPEEALFVREQVAFYASTPSYRKVMALHGWEQTAEQLSTHASRGRWDEMSELIDAEMLATFALVAPPKELADGLKERYTGLADRLSIYSPFVPGERDAFWRELVQAFS
jgi:probable F420-dependent oxidoreductase